MISVVSTESRRRSPSTKKEALPRLVAPEDRCGLHAFERVPGARRHIFDECHLFGQPAARSFGDDVEQGSQPAIADQRDGQPRRSSLEIRSPDNRHAGFEVDGAAEGQHGEGHDRVRRVDAPIGPFGFHGGFVTGQVDLGEKNPGRSHLPAQGGRCGRRDVVRLGRGAESVGERQEERLPVLDHLAVFQGFRSCPARTG